MKKKHLLMISTLLVTSLALSGCSLLSDNAEEEPIEEIDETLVDAEKVYKSLEDGCYYVQHANKTCEKVYFGQASFDEGNTVTTPSTNRVMWFRGDFDQIPTYHQGDSLIFYSKEELDETFTLERFMDLGYSIGVRGLKETESGRYSISTDVDEKCTYPESDADQLLLLENDNVIIESVSRVALRNDTTNPDNNLVTDYGTVSKLPEETPLNIKVFEGTEENDYVFTTDVRILGSMEAVSNNNFEFTENNIIVIDIPSYFHDGYYLINGAGLFRYVTSEDYDTSNDAKESFNIANVEEEEEGELIASANDESLITSEYDSKQSSLTSENGKIVTAFTVKENTEDALKVYLEFTTNDQVEASKGQLPSATLIDPDGNKISFFTYGSTGLYTEVDDAPVGRYTIDYKNLGNYKVNCNITGAKTEM